MHDFSKEAVAYFDAYLADDPVTAKTLARLDLVADELEAAGAQGAIGAAMFARALELADAKSWAALPFELDETTCQIIDGARSRPAMNEHCSTAETRQAAAVLNTIGRIVDGKQSYAWADEVLRQGPLKTYAQVSLSVVDDELAGVPLALNHELRFLPRLDTQQALDSDEEHQTVLVAALVLFWVEDGQVHCGVNERYSLRWARVVRFARRRGYPVHVGFQGEILEDERMEEILALIEERTGS